MTLYGVILLINPDIQFVTIMVNKPIHPSVIYGKSFSLMFNRNGVFKIWMNFSCSIYHCQKKWYKNITSLKDFKMHRQILQT